MTCTDVLLHFQTARLSCRTEQSMPLSFDTSMRLELMATAPPVLTRWISCSEKRLLP